MRQIAPVQAIRGNVHRGAWSDEFSTTEIVEVDGQSLYVLHDLHELDLDPAAAGFRVVVSGHTHDPVVKEERGVVYLNPGSAGPRRFRLPISLRADDRRAGRSRDRRGLHGANQADVRRWRRSATDRGGTDFAGINPFGYNRRIAERKDTKSAK